MVYDPDDLWFLAWYVQDIFSDRMFKLSAGGFEDPSLE